MMRSVTNTAKRSEMEEYKPNPDQIRARAQRYGWEDVIETDPYAWWLMELEEKYFGYIYTKILQS